MRRPRAGTLDLAHVARRAGRISVWLVGLTLFAAAPLIAHVTLLAPNGAELLSAGDPFLIRWEVAVGHDTQDWDLWYSVSGETGPWIPIALDLPPGDIGTGALHDYQWTVPDQPSVTVRVRVQQDNSGLDYEDVSDSDLTIESSTLIFEDGFEAGDTLRWQ